MPFTIPMEVEREFDAACGAHAAFALLRDVPESAANFPTLDELYELGAATYLWELRPLGLNLYTLRTRYVCRYTSNARARSIRWSPVKNEEDCNTRVRGTWKIQPLDENACRVRFHTTVDTDIPLPQVAQVVVAPLLRRAFARMIDGYVKNLRTTFTARGRKARPKALR